VGRAKLAERPQRFIDPDTYRQVTLDCLDADLAGTRLLVVGCEQQINQDERKGDIWLLERSLNQPASAAQTPIATLVWSTPAALTAQRKRSTSRCWWLTKTGTCMRFGRAGGCRPLLCGVGWEALEPSPGGARVAGRYSSGTNRCHVA